MAIEGSPEYSVEYYKFIKFQNTVYIDENRTVFEARSLWNKFAYVDLL